MTVRQGPHRRGDAREVEAVAHDNGLNINNIYNIFDTYSNGLSGVRVLETSPQDLAVEEICGKRFGAHPNRRELRAFEVMMKLIELRNEDKLAPSSCS